MRTFGACAAERCACDNIPRLRSARLRHRIRENSKEELPARQPLQPQIIFFFHRLRSHTTLSGISIPADKELPLAFSSGILIGREAPRNRPSFLSYFRRVPSPAEPAHAGPEPAGRLRKPDARAAPFRKKAPVYHTNLCLPAARRESRILLGGARSIAADIRRRTRERSSTHLAASLSTSDLERTPDRDRPRSERRNARSKPPGASVASDNSLDSSRDRFVPSRSPAPSP